MKTPSFVVLNGARAGFLALLFALITGTSAFAASGQIAAGTAGSYDWPYNCFARNPSNDTVYGFWRRDSGSTVVYSLIQWNGSAWTTVGTFDQPTINAQTSFLRGYDNVAMAIDSAGGFHVAFSGDFGANSITSTRGVYYGHSATGATGSWTFTAVENYSDPNGWKNTQYPKIKVDSNNHPHISFQYSDVNGNRSYEVHYRYFDGTTWQGSGAAGKVYVNAGNPNNEVSYANFTLDSAGKAYFSFVSELNGSGLDGSLLYVTNGGLGSFVFSSPVTLAQGQTNAETGTNSEILVDSAGHVNIIYGDHTGNINYMTNASGSFVSTVVDGSLSGGIQPQGFNQNSVGDLYFVYRNGAELRYARLISGNTTWATGTMFSFGANDGGNYYTGVLNNSRLAFALFDNTTTAPPRNFWYATVQLPNVDAFPVVITNAPTNVTSSGATLNGTVNANGVSTTASFEYGLTTGYGSSIAASPGTVTGSSATAVSATLTGLIPGATYHYRVDGVNATGAVQGGDQTFSIAAAATVSLLGTPAQVHAVATLTNFTVPAGTNRVLIVAASGEAPSGTTSTVVCDLGAVTYNGSAMTLVGKLNDGTSGYIVDGLWVLPLGTGGGVTGNIVVAPAGGTTAISSIGATAFQNVDQAAPANGFKSLLNPYVQTSPGMSSSLSVTSNPGDMAFDVFDFYDNIAHGADASGSGQTAYFGQVDTGVTGTEYYVGSLKLGASTATMSWTTTGSTETIQLAANLKQLVSATAPTLSSASASAVNYNSSGNSINVATLTAPTGSPTGWTVAASSGGTYGASAATSGGGTVSINSSGAATYAPKTAYRGNDTFFVEASNGIGTSTPATITVPVNNPAFTATLPASTASVGTAYNVAATAVTINGGQSPYSTFSATGLPPGLTISAAGVISGTPTTQGTYSSIVVTAKDSSTGTGPFTGNAAAVTITVAPGTPTANAQSVNVSFNTAKAITLTGSDPDSPPLSLTYSVTLNPTHGTLSGTAPNLTYTPTSGYNGPDTFKFTASNGTNSSTAATVTLTIAPGTPTANTQSVTTAFTTAKAISLTGSDPDSPALTLTFNAPSTPAHGALSGFNASTGAVTYTPTGNYSGSDSFTFTVTNGTNTSAAATVNVTVTPGTPTANVQSVNVSFNTAQAVTLTGSDPDNPALSLTYTVTANPAHGTLSGNAPTLTYTPTAGYHGADSFNFTASNGTNTSSAATVTLTVATGTPTATPQAVTTAFNTVKGITLAGTDPDVPPLSLTYNVSANPTHGTLSGTAPNLTYTPSANFGGSDSFQFTVNNGANTSAAGTVNITVTPGTPAANAQTVAVTFNTAKVITLTGTDPDNPALSLTYTVTANPAHGTLSGNAPTLTFTPTASYQGSDSFQFTVSNGTNTSTAAVVTINVGPGAPTANAQSVTTAFNTAKAITLTGTDPDSPALPLTFNAPSTPAHGVLSGFNASTGAVTYTPNSNFQGTDSFTFTVSNGTNTSSAATVSLTVTPGTPTATAQPVNVVFNTAKAITLAGTDPDSPVLPLTFNAPSTPGHGALSGFNASTGAVTYTPTNGFQGSDSFTFTVTNGTNTSTAATVSISVGPGVPAANTQSVTTAFNTAKPITLTGSDPDVPALTLTFNTPSTPAHGVLSGFNASTGAVIYTPNNNFHGSDSFTFTVTNGTSTSSAGTVNITVTPGTPAATPQSQNIAFNTALGLTLAATDPDSPSLTLTFAIGASPTHGSLSGFNASTGAVSYTPTAGYTGSDSFTFTANNGTNTSATATVTLTVATGVPTANAQTVSVTFAMAKAITLTGSDPDVPAKTLTFALGASPSNGALSGFNASTGAVTYTPTAGYNGSDSFTFTVNNGTNTSSAATVTLNVAPGTPTANAQTLITTIFTPVNFTLTGSDPDLPALPLTFAAGTPGHGSITSFSASAGTGTYTPTGNYSGPDSFTFTVNNGTNTSASATVSITVNPLSINTASLPNGTLYVNYNQTLNVTSGPGTLTFSVSAGALPDGLTLNTSTGQISGLPTNTNGGTAYNFTILVSDTNGGSTSHAYSVSMAAPTIVVAPPNLNALQAGVPFSQQLSASGGLPAGAYAFIVTGNAPIPAGLTLDSSGLLHGTPTVGGPVFFTVQATDSTTLANGGPFAGLQLYSPAIAAPNITLSPATLLDGQVGVSYSQSVAASGGTAPYTYSVSAGTLPAGLQLNTSTGAISGTPTAGGPFSFTIQAVDSSAGAGPYSQTQTFTPNMAAPAISVDLSALTAGTATVPYSQKATAAGGTAPYTFTATGTLPAGLTLDSDGTLHGTPTLEGTYNFTITATDSSTGTGPFSAQSSTSIVVDFVPVFSSLPTATPNPAVVDVSVTFSAATVPADAVITWNFGDGSATETGSSVNHIYTVAGNYTVVSTARNIRSGTTSTTTISLTVADAGAEAFLPGTTLTLLTQGSVRFNSNGDRLIIKSLLPTTTLSSGSGVTLSLKINGLTRTFTFDAKGHEIAGGDRASIRHITRNSSRLEFHATLTGALKAGCTSEVALDGSELPKLAVVEISVGDTTYSAIQPIKYSTSSVGKFGYKKP